MAGTGATRGTTRVKVGRQGTRAAGLWGLLRPGNGVMSVVAVGVGAYVAGGAGGVTDASLRVLLGAVAAFAFTGAGNAANDLRDVDVDRHAHPERPLVTGAVTPREVRVLVVTLYAIAALAALGLGWPAFALVAGALVLMEAYERRFKSRGLAGNVLVGALTGAPFVVGGLAVGSVPLTVAALAGLAALATTGREILKDVEDMDSDATWGQRRTLPLRVGRGGAHAVAASLLVVAIALSPLPFLLETLLGWLYLAIVGIADAGFLAAALLASRPGLAQRLAKGGMLVALAAFVAGKLHAELSMG